MAFNLFKKKEDDDFSDFTTPKHDSLDNSHLGLPEDSDITNVASSPSNNLALPELNNGNNDNFDSSIDNSTASSPSSFNDFNNMKSRKAFMASQQEPDRAIQQMSHKPTREELMHKVDNIEKDMEIVTAKLDTIKSLLDTMSHRMEHLEKAAEGKKEEVRW